MTEAAVFTWPGSLCLDPLTLGIIIFFAVVGSTRGSLMAHYLYACLSQIFTVHIHHFQLGFGYTVNTDYTPTGMDDAIALNTRSNVCLLSHS